jgi:hypothetical protein
MEVVNARKANWISLQFRRLRLASKAGVTWNIIRGVDLCQTLGGPNPFPAHPYPLPLLPPFPSSLLLLPFVPLFSSLPSPSSPLPLVWGSGGYAPGNFFSGTHARTRVLVHF